ncbi:hypothetical protein ACFY71_35240 [Streptomyces cinerochromogenes]|uniref:hypothetical protein n=1 Tax=Streptomyces cinerochromogenes TaxID=66422 RepID=UPI0036AA96AA
MTTPGHRHSAPADLSHPPGAASARSHYRPAPDAADATEIADATEVADVTAGPDARSRAV